MRLRVAVVHGGTDAEHEVSLRSGAEVLEHIPHDATAALWRRDGLWEIPSGTEPVGADVALGLLRGFDCAFLALHGPGGEDGRIQGFLETAGVPYTGSGVLASALAMNKAVAKTVARSLAIGTADDVLLRMPGDARAAGERLGYPCVLKPVSSGSSADLRVVDGPAEMEAAATDVLSRWPEVLAEAFVAGTEVTGPVVEDPETAAPRALPVVEIRYPGRRVFDPEAKYVPGCAEEICPARIPDDAAGAVRDAALRLHVALGCRGFSRSDFLLRDGVPVFLETNTIPGLTRESLLPKAARAAGISMAALLDGLVRCATRGRVP